MMDFLLGKCIILKNLPETASEEDVRKCLELNNLSDAFHDIERYAVNDTDIRWIILFNTAEDAMMCLHTKAWVYPNGDDRALITPEICVENLIPDRWLEQMQVSIISETANKESEYVPMQSFGLSVLMTSDLDEDFEIDIGESGSESVISTKVTITGFQVVTANEEMKTFFESKSRSGGGDIVAFELNQYRNVVTVEFKNHNDATEVLKKANKEGGILYNGMMLKVSPFIEPLIDTSKVFVSGMSDKTSDELAALFMEAKWHIVPKKLVRGILPGTALVEFDSHPDITKLKSICEKNACAEAFWNVSQVEVPSKVLVTGCSSTTTKELLDLYFDNKKRSGGGDVLYVEPHHDCSNEFVIIFKYVSDAERVVKEDRTHVLDNCKLTVALYYPCLDRDPPEEIAIPEPVLIDDLDKYRAKYDNVIEKLEKEITELQGQNLKLAEERHAFKKTIDQDQNIIKNLEQQIKNFKWELCNFEKRLNEGEILIQDKNKTLEVLLDTRNKHLQDISALDNAVRKYQQDIEDRDRTIMSLGNDLQSQSKEHKDLKIRFCAAHYLESIEVIDISYTVR